MKSIAFPAQSGGILGVGTRELRLGPYALGSLLLTRKIYVSPSVGYVRYVDVAENPGTVAASWSSAVIDNLGYAAAQPILTSGDATFSRCSTIGSSFPRMGWGAPSSGVSSARRTAAAEKSLAQYGQTAVPNAFPTAVRSRRRAGGRVVQWAIRARTPRTPSRTEAILDRRRTPAAMDAIDRMTAANADPVPAVFECGPGHVHARERRSIGVPSCFTAGFHRTIRGCRRYAFQTRSAQTDLYLPVSLSITGAAWSASAGGAGRAWRARAGFRPNRSRRENPHRVPARFRAPASITLYDVRGKVLGGNRCGSPRPVGIDRARRRARAWRRLDADRAGRAGCDQEGHRPALMGRRSWPVFASGLAFPRQFPRQSSPQ
jgi:hypothetical protein